jgi:hypothetical protein
LLHCCREPEVLLLLPWDVLRRRHDALWRSQALRTLPALMAASDMLICGEDLGFVPACLPPVMQVGSAVLWYATSLCVMLRATVYFTCMFKLRIRRLPYVPK